MYETGTLNTGIRNRKSHNFALNVSSEKQDPDIHMIMEMPMWLARSRTRARTHTRTQNPAMESLKYIMNSDFQQSLLFHSHTKYYDHKCAISRIMVHP